MSIFATILQVTIEHDIGLIPLNIYLKMVILIGILYNRKETQVMILLEE